MVLVQFALCTISDVERLHKAYSRIHTSSRNRLSDDRVDRLTMGRVARRLNAIPSRRRFDIDATPLKKKVDAEYERDLEAWGQRTIAHLAPTDALLSFYECNRIVI